MLALPKPRKRSTKDKNTSSDENNNNSLQQQPNYITAILPNDQTTSKNYKNQYGGHSNSLRWSQDEVDLIEHVVNTPARICEKEWLATHILSLSNNVKLLYELIGIYCTPTTCPKMCGVRGEIFYQENTSSGKSNLLSAPGYVDWAFAKLQEIAEDQNYRQSKNMTSIYTS